MAAVDYFGILTKIEEKLNADPLTSSVKTFIEQDPVFGMSDLGSAIALYLDNRTPTAMQAIAAGSRTRYGLNIVLWVVAFSLESFRKACETRDSVLGNVELVLMKNRSIDGYYSNLQLNGGEFRNAINESGSNVFCALASIRVGVDVVAIN